MNELISVAIITVLAVISPGADFAIVTRNSLAVSRKIGFFTALGISLGVLVHISYSIFGIGLIISKSIILFNVLKVTGATYLVFLGIKMILTGKTTSRVDENVVNEILPLMAVRNGFLTNILNPKTTLFIVSLFSQMITQDSSRVEQMGYGLFISLTHLAWFLLVAFFFSTSSLKDRIQSIRHIIEKSIGSILCLLGVGLLRSSL